MFSIGCVPYVNALPLIWALRGREDLDIQFDVPSALPSLLEAGKLDAMLVSSYDAITRPGRQAVDGVCIGSRHHVESVRLFSKVPIERIGTLSLDASSMTSNALAKIVLARQFGIHPECVPRKPDLREMLASSDACVMIGDKGMMASPDGLQVIDLGAAWHSMTGLPFVWALWVGRNIPAELAEVLSAAPQKVQRADFDAMAEEASESTGLEHGRLLRYLSSTIEFRLDAEMAMGLERFAQEVRFLEGVATSLPEWVGRAEIAKTR